VWPDYGRAPAPTLALADLEDGGGARAAQSRTLARRGTARDIAASTTSRDHAASLITEQI
jgi:hypothetical protein